MKIVHSTLSMEAFTSNRDVILGRTDSAAKVSGTSAQYQGGSERFILNLDDRATPPAARSVSTTEVQNDFELPEKEDDETGRQTQILTSATEAVLGTGVSISEFRRESRASLSAQFRSRQADAFAMNFSSLAVREKSSTLDFQSSGKIVAADGREIEFSLDLSVSSTEVTRQIRLPANLLLDPLVLSFDDGFSALSGTSFSFDLNADGDLDNIASLAKGSGFLSLDKNGDGVINDGTELFGPLSGNGYADLLEYDQDDNLWIDENDPIFAELKVWMGAGGAESSLISLREAGVGAISLASVGSEFELKGDNGEVLGQITRAGIFLMENGEELDLNLDVSGEENPRRESVASIDQAIFLLRDLIAKRKAYLEQLQHRQGLAAEVRERRLLDRFWQWQERNYS